MGASVVRERIDPRRLSVRITTVSGSRIRWGPDESSAERVPRGINITTKMPGGFGTFGCSLQRVPDFAYEDLDRFAPCSVVGAGGFLTAFDGYLATRPSQRGGDTLISPEAVGWQAALNDAPLKEVFVDIDKTQWQPASVQRKKNIAATTNVQDAGVVADTTTQQPALGETFSDTWGAAGLPDVEALYDKGIPLGSLYYAWNKNANVNAADVNWQWSAQLWSDDVGTVVDSSGNLRAAGPGTGTVTAAGTRKFAVLTHSYGIAGGAAGAVYTIFWSAPGVYGTHGLTKQGAGDAVNPPGLLGSDIVKNIVNRTAPMLSADLTTNGGLIVPNPFVVPHLTFLDPTSGADALTAANRFFLNDFGVYEAQKFFWQPPGGFRQWRLRLSDAVQPDDDGPQIETAFNGVIVTYQDTTGISRSVGPPGTTVDTTSTLLQDTSATNPVNLYGRTRYAQLDMGGTSTPAGAIQAGQLFLATALSRPSHGQTRVTGFATDSTGHEWPVWMMRAGDTVIYEDSADKAVRTIIDTNYDHDQLTNTCTLDSPPNRLDWLLQRLQVVLVPFGLGG